MDLINSTLNIMAPTKGQTSAILCGRARHVCRLPFVAQARLLNNIRLVKSVHQQHHKILIALRETDKF